jgi:hypothetical protein
MYVKLKARAQVRSHWSFKSAAINFHPGTVYYIDDDCFKESLFVKVDAEGRVLTEAATSAAASAVTLTEASASAASSEIISTAADVVATAEAEIPSVPSTEVDANVTISAEAEVATEPGKQRKNKRIP